MKRFLPNQKGLASLPPRIDPPSRETGRVETGRGRSGFTLIELLIVVSIIAILSVIGIVIFSTITGRARDSRRISDIDSIANAMEANVTGSQYVALADSQFQSNKIPQDPINGGTSTNCGTAGMCLYCSLASLPSARFTSCSNTVGAAHPAAGATYVVCANLEGTNGPGGANFYCRQNVQ